ncbi:MAG: TolC family protein [Flavobacteriaceae bacterium]
MKHIYRYIIFGLLFILSSCGSYQNYTRENPEKLEAYRNAKESTDTTSIATMDWKSFFKDEVLIGHIETALVKNLDMQRAQQNLGIAQSLVKQSKASYLPSVNASFDASRSKPSNQSFNGQVLPKNVMLNDFSLGAGFAWEIDVWGKISSQKRAAIAQYYQTENAQRLIQSQVVNAVASYYYTLQSLDAKKAIVEQTILNRSEGIETTKALKESGSVTEVAVKQTEAQLLTAQAILIDIMYQINITENALSLLLGKAPQSISRSVFPEVIDNDHMLKTGMPIQLLNNRPDVLMAEYNLVQSVELTNAAQASFYPTLSITGGGGLNSENFSDLFNANSIFANIAGGLLQPIFNQRKLKTQKEIRLYEQEVAVLDYKQSVLTGYQEVSNTLSNISTSKEKLTIKYKEKEALYKSLEYSEELQEQGFVNYLEILRAKDLTLNAELEVVNLKLSQLIGQTNLYRALGGGWQ